MDVNVIKLLGVWQVDSCGVGQSMAGALTLGVT